VKIIDNLNLTDDDNRASMINFLKELDTTDNET